MRNIKLFFKALWLTLKGEKPPELPHQDLRDWIQAGVPIAQNTLEILNTTNEITVKVDGRNQSATVIVKGIVYHLTQEYPYLLKHLTEHSALTIHATNMNDQYALQRLLESSEMVPNTPLKKHLDELKKYLDQMPSSPKTD